MSDRVPERMLERARLGELNDAEIAELMKRLEAEEGGLARLDALIEGDAEFLERFPTGPMVAQIRDRIGRSTRAQAHEPSEKNMTNLIAVPQIALITSILAVAAVVGVGLANRPQPEPRPEKPAADAVELPAAPVTPSRIAHDTTEAPTIFDALADRARVGKELILAPGESIDLPANGISRVTIDSTLIASATTTDDSGRQIRLTAGKPGLTTVRFQVENGEQVLYLRVAPRLEDQEPVETSRLEECHAAAQKAGAPRGEASIFFLVAAPGAVVTANVESSTLGDEFTKCLAKPRGWKFPAFEGSADIPQRTARLKLVFDGSRSSIKHL